MQFLVVFVLITTPLAGRFNLADITFNPTPCDFKHANQVTCDISQDEAVITCSFISLESPLGLPPPHLLPTLEHAI